MSADVGQVKLLGEHRRGEAFEVGGYQLVDFLSHGTVLEDCTVTIAGSARGVVFHGATLQRCTVRAERPFANLSWHDVVLDRCTFVGRFVGCDFGPRPDAYPDHPRGGVAGCDFGAARLHKCRVFRSGVGSLRLPRWPCFAVLEPERNAADWLSIPFPESFRRVEQPLIAEAAPEYRVAGMSAACQDAGEIAKRHAIPVEEIRRLLDGRPYIRL